MRPPQFSIVTPSFRSLKWLPLNVASVADQTGVDHEHIVQDSCSDDGTGEWLARQTGIRSYIEKDLGMYDAVSRGWRRASGDVLSYLNCDEQYLPGALERVARAFAENPRPDAVLGACIVIGEHGEYRCDRRVLAPSRWHTLVGGNLSFLTAGCFVRREFVERHALYFDPQWRMAGDAEWTARLVRCHPRVRVLDEFTSAFTITGTNLMMTDRARDEERRLAGLAPGWVRAAAPVFKAAYRFRRLLAGHHRTLPHRYSVYTTAMPSKRTEFSVGEPRWRWS